MRIGMRLLLGYFLLVAVAAWFVLAMNRSGASRGLPFRPNDFTATITSRSVITETLIDGLIWSPSA